MLGGGPPISSLSSSPPPSPTPPPVTRGFRFGNIQRNWVPFAKICLSLASLSCPVCPDLDVLVHEHKAPRERLLLCRLLVAAAVSSLFRPCCRLVLLSDCIRRTRALYATPGSSCRHWSGHRVGLLLVLLDLLNDRFRIMCFGEKYCSI